MHQIRKVSAGNQAAIPVWHASRRNGWLSVAAVSAAALLTAGCGQSYRPVVSAINPVGPAGQPTKFAIALSIPSATSKGLITAVDFSGDTILATPSVLQNPTYFTLGNGGTTAYIINASGSLDSVPVSNPANLITSDVSQTTLVAGSNPVSISPIAGTNSGTIIFIPQTGSGSNASIAALTAIGPSLLANIATGTNPNYVVGNTGAARVYALVSGTGAGPGQVLGIETTTAQPTISTTLTVGTNPVYGIMPADLQRAFILNKGSGTVSVINTSTNALDATTPTIPNAALNPGLTTLGQNPIWAVSVPALFELAVLNAGDGVHPGSLSIISVPLCNQGTPVTNPNCNAANPTDAVGFGTVVATVPVGVNPTMVDVLSDGSRAYVVNQANVAGVCNGEGSVTVVNLTANVVTSTICATSSAASTIDASTSPTLVYGHPNTLSVTSGVPTGKVYITSWDSKFMTVLRTDLDTVQTHISLQGLGLPLATGSHPQTPGVLVTQP